MTMQICMCVEANKLLSKQQNNLIKGKIHLNLRAYFMVNTSN